MRPTNRDRAWHAPREPSTLEWRQWPARRRPRRRRWCAPRSKPRSAASRPAQLGHAALPLLKRSNVRIVDRRLQAGYVAVGGRLAVLPESEAGQLRLIEPHADALLAVGRSQQRLRLARWIGRQIKVETRLAQARRLGTVAVPLREVLGSHRVARRHLFDGQHYTGPGTPQRRPKLMWYSNSNSPGSAERLAISSATVIHG